MVRTALTFLLCLPFAVPKAAVAETRQTPKREVAMAKEYSVAPHSSCKALRSQQSGRVKGSTHQAELMDRQTHVGSLSRLGWLTEARSISHAAQS